MQTIKNLLTVLFLSVFLSMTAPSTAMANDEGTESGDELAIVVDLFALRPVGLVMTVGGLALFVGSLPISLPTLSVGKAFKALVVGPARYTFVRKLGDEYIVPE